MPRGRSARGKVGGLAGEGGRAAAGKVERNLAALRDGLSCGERLGQVGKQPAHFRRALEIELGRIVRAGPGSQLGQSDEVLGREEDVAQPVLLDGRVVDVVGGDHGQPGRPRDRQQARIEPGIVGQPVPLQFDPHPLTAEDVGQLARGPRRNLRVVCQHGSRHRAPAAPGQAQQPLRTPRHVLDRQQRAALAARQLPDAD